LGSYVHRRRHLPVLPSGRSLPSVLGSQATRLALTLRFSVRTIVATGRPGGMIEMGELPDQPVLTEADDGWHDFSPHWWETETNWWSFNVPERKLGGWLYTQALGVQQI